MKNKKMQLIIKLSAALSAAALTAGAQAAPLFLFQAHAGVALPVGRFASDRSTKDIYDGHGHAATGFNAGAKLYVPFSASPELSAVAGLEGFYNGLQADYKENVEDVLDAAAADADAEVTHQKYINAALTAGLRYSYTVNGSLQLYGEAGAGAGISKITSKITSSRVEYDEQELMVAFDVYEGYGFPISQYIPSLANYKTAPVHTESYKASFSFAYGVEAGVIINERVSVGVRYSSLGSHRYHYTSELEVKLPRGDEVYDLFDLEKNGIRTWWVLSDGSRIEVENSDKTSYTSESEGRFNRKLPVGNVSIALGIFF